MYPLIGKIFYDELQTALSKLQPKNTFDEVFSNFPNLPFEKE